MMLVRYVQKLVYAFFIALDLLVSALTNGEAWETISARLYIESNRRTNWLWLKNLVDWAALHGFAEPFHCFGAYQAFLARQKATSNVG